MAATIFDHPGFLLLIAFIALVRWLISKAKTAAQDTQTPMESPPTQPITRASETQTEEERIRKFLEALGQPAGTPPPKVVPRRRQIRPDIASPLPPVTTKPPPLVVERRVPVTPPPLPLETAVAYTARRLESDFQVQEFVRQTSSERPPERRPAAAPFNARLKLGTPQDLRTAIVLREIFGPPRSLQPLDRASGY